MKSVCGFVENVCDNTYLFWNFRYLVILWNLSVKGTLNWGHMLGNYQKILGIMKETSERLLSNVVVWRCSVKKLFWKTSRYSQENTCAGVSFWYEIPETPVQVFSCELCKKKIEHLFCRTSWNGCFWVILGETAQSSSILLLWQ